MLLNSNELWEIHEYANQIWRCSEFSEERQYDRIFSPAVSQRVCQLIPGFDWCDPDTSYQEDVDAFMYAFNAEMQEGR